MAIPTRMRELGVRTRNSPLAIWSLANFIENSMCAMAFSFSTAKAAAHSGLLMCKLRAWSVDNVVHGGLKMTSTALVSMMRLLTF